MQSKDDHENGPGEWSEDDQDGWWPLGLGEQRAQEDELHEAPEDPETRETAVRARSLADRDFRGLNEPS